MSDAEDANPTEAAVGACGDSPRHRPCRATSKGRTWAGVSLRAGNPRGLVGAGSGPADTRRELRGPCLGHRCQHGVTPEAG